MAFKFFDPADFDTQPPCPEWHEPAEVEAYWRERVQYWEDRAKRAESSNSDHYQNREKMVRERVAEEIAKDKARMPDSDIVRRAKSLLLMMKGFGLANDTSQTFTLPPKAAERLVALAILGSMFDDARRAGATSEVDLADLFDQWVKKTNLLVGDIVDAG